MQLDGLRILLASDGAADRRAAQRALEGLGACVTAVGAQALERVGMEHFDVLLIDIETREAAGLAAVRRIEAAPGGRPTVIALAATGGTAGSAEAAGAAGVVSKRASAEELGREICRLRGPKTRSGAPGEGSPVVDATLYAVLADAVGGAALDDFLATVEEDVAASVGDLAAAVKAGDMAGVRAATHVLVAVAGAVGAAGLQRLAERLNRAAREGDTREVARLAAAARDEAARLRAFLDGERAEAGQ